MHMSMVWHVECSMYRSHVTGMRHDMGGFEGGWVDGGCAGGGISAGGGGVVWVT